MKKKEFKEIFLPAIGQGCGGNDVCEDSHRIKVIQHGIELGMTLIDTAESYRNGHSEKIVGKAISGKRDRVFICTKFSPEHHSYNDIIKSLDGSLRRLETDYVDLYQIHWPNPSVPIEETMRALNELQEKGKIRYIGVSNFSLREFDEANELCPEGIFSNQLEYNLFERCIEGDFLPFSERREILTIAYNPLLRGQRGQELLSALSYKYDKNVCQIILNWIVSHKSVVPIPKTLNLKHLKENAFSSDFSLDEEDIDAIDRIFKSEVFQLPTQNVCVIPSDKEIVYVTLEEALENSLRLKPSPIELAAYLSKYEILKPIRVKKNKDGLYDLVQGRIRYWAWIIAYGSDLPIPAIMHE